MSTSNASYYNRRASLSMGICGLSLSSHVFHQIVGFFNESSHVNNCSLGTAVSVLEKPLRGTQRGFRPGFTEAIQSIFRPLEMYSKRRYKVCIRSIILK